MTNLTHIRAFLIARWLFYLITTKGWRI